MSTIELEVGEARFVEWSEREYMTDRTAISRSDLMRLRRDPGEFEHHHELGRKLGRQDTNDGMTLGTSVHLAVLQPMEWQRRVGIPKVPKPKGAKKGTSAYETWRAACDRREGMMASIEGRLDLTVDEWSQTSALTAAVWAHPEAAALLSAQGWIEQTVLWREPSSGLLVKVRVDKLSELTPADVYGTDLEPGLAEVDIKSGKAISPREFLRSIRSYGYDIQASLYCDAVETATGRRPCHYWISVCNQPSRDGRHRVAVYRRSEEAHEAGRRRYQALLAEINERREANNWRSDWESGAPILEEWTD